MTVDVTLRGLGKRFGAVDAVSDLDLDAPAGDITALLGPSGCGKTTTLRMIAGFERPDAGAVSIGGRVVAAPGAGAWVPPEHRRVGMVFQQLALFPHLDVAGNIAYGLHGLDRRDRRARVGELLAMVGLAGYEGRYPDELSGGQAQRVALARALAPRPQVVLLDEPFSSLDVSLRAGLRTEVRRILKSEGVTAVLVTHDQDEALSLGDRVAVMLDGRLAQAGPPEVVYRQPSTPAVAEFLGDANLVAGEVREGVLTTELGRAEVEGGPGPVWALVRPEDLDLDVDPAGDARVLEVEYYGHDQLVTVALPSGVVLRARLHARRRFETDALVAVRLGGLGVVAFPRADEASLRGDRA